MKKIFILLIPLSLLLFVGCGNNQVTCKLSYSNGSHIELVTSFDSNNKLVEYIKLALGGGTDENIEDAKSTYEIYHRKGYTDEDIEFDGSMVIIKNDEIISDFDLVRAGSLKEKRSLSKYDYIEYMESNNYVCK